MILLYKWASEYIYIYILCAYSSFVPVFEYHYSVVTLRHVLDSIFLLHIVFCYAHNRPIYYYQV